ncbi:MAG: YCF48-related protein [Candidatus Xenobia bacterium]
MVKNLLLLAAMLLTACALAAPGMESAPALLPEKVPLLHAWLQEATPARADLNSISFASPDQGWAVGQKGTILATQDGGAHWTEQASGTKENLRDIDFVTPKDGWAVGDKGVLLHTMDGGAHWIVGAEGTKTLHAVSFRNPEVGFICGDGGTMVRTMDGGRTWQLLTVPQLVPLYAIAREPGRRLVVVGGPSVVYETRFGRWVDVFSHVTTKFKPEAVFVSNDNGQTWEKAATPSHKPLLAVSAVDALHLWAVGGDLRYTRDWLAGKVPDFGTPIVVTSDNGGKTWHEQTTGGSRIRGLLTDVHFLDPQRGWAVGFQFQTGIPFVPIPFSTNGPTLPVWLYTENGGATWQTVTWYPAPVMTRMAFLDRTHAWAAGRGGSCMRFHPQWQAETLYDSRDWVHCTAVARQLMQDDPSDPEAAWLAGLGEARQGHLEAAEKLANRLVELDPQHAAGWYLRAVLAWSRHHLDAAREADRRAIRLAPDDPHAFYLMGLLMLAQGENRLAAPYFQRYLLLDQSGPLASQARVHLQMLDRGP